MFGFVEKTWRYHQCRGFQGLIAWMLLIGEGVTRDLLPLSSVGAASREKLEGKDMKCDVKIGVGCYQNPEFPQGIALLGWVFLALLPGFALNIKVPGGSSALSSSALFPKESVPPMGNPELYSREFPDPGAPTLTSLLLDLSTGLAGWEAEFNDRGKYVQCH